jgi:hypothetical protein
MLLGHPDVFLRSEDKHLDAVSLISLGSIFNLQFDMLNSAILLDIMRAMPLPGDQIKEARWDSWYKEIHLSEGMHRPSMVNWSVFFDPNQPPDSQISTMLPINPKNIEQIRIQLCHFRRKYTESTLYARATHKNMSWSTRREFERDSGLTLEEVPIYGQDDWQRYYHSSGVKLEGVCEMRQKWYASGAKPRTYFAQGGTSYTHSRFLQDFFTDLANAFTPTHHIDRLRPERLVGSTVDRDDPHFFIYDLSNFTSNMSEQREFCYELAKFFEGVPVRTLDEKEGFVWRDLGELLLEYCIHCVEGVALSYERWDSSLDDHVAYHGVASLLGIFGNLMTCTVAHFFIVSTTSRDWNELNVAGDDGVKASDRLDNYDDHLAISLVGNYSRHKCFWGDDPCPICLKRPFIETFPTATNLTNIIPPTLITTLSYLTGSNVDPRYTTVGLEDLPFSKRLSTIGKDLFRFLASAYMTTADEEDVAIVFEGFCQIVKNFAKSKFDPWCPSLKPLWPVHPATYDFHSAHPAMMLASRASLSPRLVKVVGRIPDQDTMLRSVGDEVLCNSSKRLQLLVRLGYLMEEEEEVLEVDEYRLFQFWYNKLMRIPPVDQPLYRYQVIRDVPDIYLY